MGIPTAEELSDEWAIAQKKNHCEIMLSTNCDRAVLDFAFKNFCIS